MRPMTGTWRDIDARESPASSDGPASLRPCARTAIASPSNSACHALNPATEGCRSSSGSSATSPCTSDWNARRCCSRTWRCGSGERPASTRLARRLWRSSAPRRGGTMARCGCPTGSTSQGPRSGCGQAAALRRLRGPWPVRGFPRAAAPPAGLGPPAAPFGVPT